MPLPYFSYTPCFDHNLQSKFLDFLHSFIIISQSLLVPNIRSPTSTVGLAFIF